MTVDHPTPPRPRPSIRCPDCGLVSHHPDDIRYRYCGKCKRFRPDPNQAMAATVPPVLVAAIAYTGARLVLRRDRKDAGAHFAAFLWPARGVRIFRRGSTADDALGALARAVVRGVADGLADGEGRCAGE